MTIKATMEEVGGIAIVVIVVGLIIAFLNTNLPTYLMQAFNQITS